MCGKEDERRGQEQRQHFLRAVETEAEVFPQTAEAVEHGVAVGEKPLAGELDGVVAGEIGIHREAQLRPMLGVIAAEGTDTRIYEVGAVGQAAERHQAAKL